MEEEKSGAKTTVQSFWELARFALVALAIVIPIRLLVAEPFVVSGSSMVPTLENRNYLIVDKISYKLTDPKRQDIIIFRYPKDQTKFFVKRIIGLPNEIVDIKGGAVTITNGSDQSILILDEPYVKNLANNVTHFELKDNEYFVMGDNRRASSDSRYWGAVDRNLITGRAFLRLLPINNIGILPGQ